MLYDGSNPLHARQAGERLRMLIDGGKVFELTERRPGRTSGQNRYLRVCLAFFGCQTGETAEYVKRYYYKMLCNKDIFMREREDRYLGRISYLRSSADLDSGEMALSIDRFRAWASSAAGVYIPSPDERRLIGLMEVEVERNREFI